MAIFLIPLPQFHQRAEPDEKALLIGQSNRKFSWTDVHYLNDHLSNVYGNPSERLGLVKKEFEQLGMDVSVQSFTWSNGTGDVTGTNVHGILRAPRGDGVESALLAAPWYLHDGTRTLSSSC